MPPRAQKPVPARARRNRHAQHLRQWHHKWITRTELRDYLIQGFSNADVARVKGVHEKQVTRAKATLFQDPNVAIEVLGILSTEYRKVKDPLFAPQRIEGQVDPVDTMLSALADIWAVRNHLDTAEGQKLTPSRQMQILLTTAEARMNWAGKFVDVRHKILELIAVDTWIAELTDMLRDVQREHTEVLALAGVNLRQVFLDRIRTKILGRPAERLAKETSTLVTGERINDEGGDPVPPPVSDVP